MDKNDIIRMAREVGLLPDNSHPAPQTRHMAEKQAVIERFATLVAVAAGDQQYALGYLDGNGAGFREGMEAEREACAKVCEHDVGMLGRGEIGQFWADKCAAAIRARGNQ